MEDQTEKPRLLAHEWLAIAFLIGFLLFLTLLSLHPRPYSHRLDAEHPHYITDPFVEVHVEGAVAHPGKMRIERESTVQDVLNRVELLPDADLRRVKLEAKVRQNKRIKVPFRKKNKIDN